jgi:transposase
MTWHPKHLTTEQLQERRLEAARLLQDSEVRQSDIARELGVSRNSVHRWAKQLRSSGGSNSCLWHHPRIGRPPSLSPRQWHTVIAWLSQGAPAAGYPTDRWTLARMQHLIQKRMGVPISQSYLGRKLHQLGWSVQVPIPQARERDEEAVKAWLLRDWPALKKRLLG